jgi:hypothetical protein
MTRRRRTKPGISDESVAALIAIEKEIREHADRAKELRRQMREEFDGGHIYVIEFASGMTKVGKTMNASARFDTHARHAEVHGNPIVRSWTSPMHPGCSGTEKLLKRFCAQAGTRKTGEYFTGVRFEMAREYAERLAENQRQAAYLAAAIEDAGGGEPLTLAELAERAASLAEPTRERAAYLERLITAVNGNLGATWAQAQAALDSTT